MTDNELIKALKCCKKAKINQDCVVLKCPFSTEYGCNIGLENLRNEALDLINRQKAEIERLQAMVNAELDTIHKLGDDYERTLEEEQELVKKARTEAIKEFAVRLKCGVPQETGVIRCADVDNLVKEMTAQDK